LFINCLILFFRPGCCRVPAPFPPRQSPRPDPGDGSTLEAMLRPGAVTGIDVDMTGMSGDEATSGGIRQINAIDFDQLYW